jgi:hypothetical protein
VNGSGSSPDLGYFDDETCRLEPINNPFGPKVFTHVFGGMNCHPSEPELTLGDDGPSAARTRQSSDPR